MWYDYYLLSRKSYGQYIVLDRRMAYTQYLCIYCVWSLSCQDSDPLVNVLTSISDKPPPPGKRSLHHQESVTLHKWFVDILQYFPYNIGYQCMVISSRIHIHIYVCFMFCPYLEITKILVNLLGNHVLVHRNLRFCNDLPEYERNLLMKTYQNSSTSYSYIP